MWMDFLDVLLGIGSRQLTQPLGVLVELEVILLCAFHVDNVNRVVVRLPMFLSLVLIVHFCVQGG